MNSILASLDSADGEVERNTLEHIHSSSHQEDRETKLKEEFW